MDFGTMLRHLLRERKMTVAELSRLTGINKNTLYSYLRRNTQRPDPAALGVIADAFHIDINTFLGITPQQNNNTKNEPIRAFPSNIYHTSELHRQRVPLIGKVAAGQPIMADEDYETYVSAPMDCDVALEVQGDSMEPTYLSGDIVYIRRQDQVDDGQVAVVILDDSATLKHVYHDKDGVTLISDNPKYAPMHFTGDDCSYMAVYGIPVGYTRMYRRRKRT